MAPDLMKHTSIEREVEYEQLIEENRKLKEQLSLYHNLSDYTSCTICRVQKKAGRFIYRFLLGTWTEKIIFNQPIDTWLSDKYIRHLTPYFEKAFTGESVDFETEHDGLFYYTKLKPITMKDGVRELISTTVNITSQKKAEEESQKNRKKFLAAFEESLNGIIIFDDDGNRISANRALCAMVGQSKEDFINQRLNDLAFINGKEVRMIDLMNEGKLEGEFQIHRSDGTQCEIEYRIKSNILPGFHLAIMRDITDRIALEKRLNKTDRIRTAGALAVSLAHEIRNPLTSIQGFLTLLQKQIDNTNSVQSDFITLMLTESATIQSLVDKLLLLAEPECGQHKKLPPENAVTLIEESLTVAEENHAAKQINVQLEFTQPNIPLHYSKKKFQHVILMLLNNSMQSMDRSGTLSLSIVDLPDGFLIRLKDDGIGIPNPILEKLGEPFYKINEKGTGLELMICYHIIESYGGSFTVDSNHHQGTLITIFLPNPEV